MRRLQIHSGKMRSITSRIAISCQAFQPLEELRAHICSRCPRAFLDDVAKIWGTEFPERTLNGKGQRKVSQGISAVWLALSVSVRASRASSLSTCM